MARVVHAGRLEHGGQPLGGRQIEQVATDWHFGYAGLAAGPSANLLTPLVGDPDTMLPEYKAFLCDVAKK